MLDALKRFRAPAVLGLWLVFWGQVFAQEPVAKGPAAGLSGSQMVKNNKLLAHAATFRLLSKSRLAGKAAAASPEEARSRRAAVESWVSKIMAKQSLVWSVSDGIDTGTAFLFPGADPNTHIQYVFAAVPDSNIMFGVGGNPQRNSVQFVDLIGHHATELAADGASALQQPIGGPGGSGYRALGAGHTGHYRPELDLPGLASDVAAVASCLWNNIASTLSVQSWSDFANLTCQLNGLGGDATEMWSFGKEITGCVSLGVADCFFLASDIALFVSNQYCRPDWVNSCINPPSQGGGGGGSPSAPIITGITGAPVPGQQSWIQIDVLSLSPAGASAAFVGPGCPTMQDCVVPSGVITVYGGQWMSVPVTLAAGSFTVYVEQLGQVSNGWPLTVGNPSNGGGGSSGSGGGGGGGRSWGGSSPNLVITFSPNPVSNSGNNTWNLSMAVSETGGAPVTITGLSIGGGDYSSYISQWFGTNQMPAYGSWSGSFTVTGGSAGDLTWTFSGNGMSWSGTVTLQP